MRMVMALLMLAQAVPPGSLTAGQVQAWFEAGQDQQLVERVRQASDGLVQYLAGRSYERLGRPAEARQAFTRLAAGSSTDPWTFIGRSAQALVTTGAAPPTAAALGEAEGAVRQALELAGAPSASGETALAVAHYQHGQVLTYRRDYTQAAAAFDRTLALRPDFAYAYYYAGMSYREIPRVDLMAIRFDRFLELAPQAPERVRVQAIMRTVR